MKNLLFAILLFFSSFYSKAQIFSVEMDHISIVVHDVDKSKEFYKNILHLKQIPTPWGENTPLPAAFFDLGNNLQLHVTEINAGNEELNMFFHFAYRINDFDGYLKFLNDKGIEYGEFSGKNMKFQTRIDGVRQIYFQEPDGYWIEVNDHKK